MKTIVNTPTPSITQSLEFYSKLNFDCVMEEKQHYAISGDLIIRINEDRYARPGMVFFHDEWEDKLAKTFQGQHKVTKDQSTFIADPNGIILELKAMEAFPKLPESRPANTIAGNFAGISIEAFDFRKTIDFWSFLDYKITMGTEEGGWVAMENDSDIGISIMKFNMCPHLFYNPSFTYFNSGNNLEVIQKIKAKGIHITEEITHFNKEGIVDNIILKDPGGFGFFIFND